MSVRRYEPVASNATLRIIWPTFSVLRQAPLPVSQILTVLSDDPDTTCVPSCEKATEMTELLWPLSVLRQAPLPASQILTVLSDDPDTTYVPSCEKAADQTEPLWPSSVLRQAPLLAS